MQDLFDYIVVPLNNLLEENIIDSEIYGYYAAVLAVAVALIGVCFVCACTYKILTSIFAYDRGF